MKSILYIIVIVCLFSCNEGRKEIYPKNLTNSVEKVIDTTINISNIPTIKVEYNFSNNEAEKFLYKYFDEKGIKPQSTVKDDLSDAGEDLFVDYDTIYKIKSEKSMAIITYWKAPAYLNGHCVLPHRAIISKNQEGFKITNEDFIPENFYIDSLNGNIIYVSDVECGNDITRHKYRIKIK